MVFGLLIIGVIFVIGELLTTSVLLIFFGAGFLTSGFILALTDNIIIAAFVGILVCILSILFIRKPILSKLHANDTKSGSDALIGKKVVVRSKIDANSVVMGEVILNGVVWNAKSEQSFDVDDVAVVQSIVGSHLIVKGDL